MNFSNDWYIFGGLRPLAPTTMDRKLAKFCEISGVKKIKMHELRYSHTSLLASMNAKPTAISKRLGHSGTEITLKTYTHMFPSNANEAVQSLNKLRKENA